MPARSTGRSAGTPRSTVLTSTRRTCPVTYRLCDQRRQADIRVNPRGVQTVGSPGSYNDGKWHHVVATLGTTGMHLYVDGTQVAERADTVQAEYRIAGYWRVGGDIITGWPSAPSSSNFAGAIDEVAVYNSALSSDAVQAHWQRGQGAVPNQPPLAVFTEKATDLSVVFDGTTSTDPTVIADTARAVSATVAPSPTHSKPPPAKPRILQRPRPCSVILQWNSRADRVDFQVGKRSPHTIASPHSPPNAGTFEETDIKFLDI
ncbi:LamG domain-containing protein [Rhodococcus erythropolis]|uniref:LamG domain-containing protein n=1 Tax=Rhodococcus erythropolis TaxID=1833 RepID=UPI0036729CAA